MYRLVGRQCSVSWWLWCTEWWGGGGRDAQAAATFHHGVHPGAQPAALLPRWGRLPGGHRRGYQAFPGRCAQRHEPGARHLLWCLHQVTVTLASLFCTQSPCIAKTRFFSPFLVLLRRFHLLLSCGDVFTILLSSGGVSPDIIPRGWLGSKHQLTNCGGVFIFPFLVEVFSPFIVLWKCFHHFVV